MERHSPLASTQTYSARILSGGYGRELNLSTTAVSSWDLPVWISRWFTMRSWDGATLDGGGANAAAAPMAAERMATESFMLATFSGKRWLEK